MLKIGVIGCGAIGKEICRAIDKKLVNGRLVGIYDNTSLNCERLIKELNDKPDIMSPGDLISSADLVVECASQAAVREFGVNVLKNGKDLMVLSVGAFLDKILFENCIRVAQTHDCRIYIPSGAIVGIDGLRSASVGQIDNVMLTTTKNPAGLKSAPFIVKNNINLDQFLEKTLIFEGNAEEAVKGFPANVNVAASLSLAGIGAKNTLVRVYVDPEASRNIHEITVEGDFGRFTCHIENVISPNNPRTSYLAALSAVATLKKITEPLQIGT